MYKKALERSNFSLYEVSASLRVIVACFSVYSGLLWLFSPLPYINV